MDMSVLPIIILLPLVLGTTLVSWLKQFSRGVTALGAIGVSLSSLILLLTQAKAVFNGKTIIQTWSWLPQLGIDLSFSSRCAWFIILLADHRNRHTHFYLCPLLFKSAKLAQ